MKDWIVRERMCLHGCNSSDSAGIQYHRHEGAHFDSGVFLRFILKLQEQCEEKGASAKCAFDALSTQSYRELAFPAEEFYIFTYFWNHETTHTERNCRLPRNDLPLITTYSLPCKGRVRGVPADICPGCFNGGGQPRSVDEIIKLRNGSETVSSNRYMIKPPHFRVRMDLQDALALPLSR